MESVEDAEDVEDEDVRDGVALINTSSPGCSNCLVYPVRSAQNFCSKIKFVISADILADGDFSLNHHIIRKVHKVSAVDTIDGF